MKQQLILGSLVLLILFGFVSAHRYYVSVTEIAYSEQETALQITSRIFIDDLQSLVQERYDKSAVLSATNESAKIDEYLNTYFQEKIKIQVDGKTRQIDFLGKEYENDMILCYLEIRSIKNPRIFEIQNRVLMDLFEAQQNIIHIKKGGERKSLLLENQKPRDMLKFSE